MEGGVAAMDSRSFMNDVDVSSYDSDSSGDSKLRMEQKLLTETHVTPLRCDLPPDHRDGVPTESPKQRRNSKERSSSLTSNSPISYSWYYNPQRDYSPSVSSVTPRKGITSWMDAMMRTPIEQDMQVEDDDISIDSVEQLEQVAAQIRSEIRQLEMKELADEAESAAEAGHESFAGRASTFGDSESSTGGVDVTTELRPSTLKRYSTYSEGTSILKQVRPIRSRPKIRCLQLRDINEVIPPIGELHSNLRTHLMLAGVERRSLEPAEANEAEKHAAQRARSVKSPVQFLSSLKSWVSTSPSSEAQSPSTDAASNITTPRQPTFRRRNKPENFDNGESSVTTLESHDSYEVGARLSEHIHEPKAVHRSPIRIPPGLDLPDDLSIPHELPLKLLSNDADGETVETVPTSSSSQQDDLNQGNRECSRHELEDLTPIALFEQVGDDDSPGEGVECDDIMISSSYSMLVSSPTEKIRELWFDASASNMFVTPNRLRGIRKASRKLASRRSLRHQSADFGWTLKVVKLQHTKSDPESLSHDDDPLDMPMLSVMSEDRDVILRDNSSVAVPPNCSRDASIASLTEKNTVNDCDPVVDSHREVSQGKESAETVIPALERPLSLSFDEYNVLDVDEPDLASDSAKGCTDELPVTDDCCVVARLHELNDTSLDCHGVHQSAIEAALSHDLSLSAAPSDEIELVNAASLVAIEVVDTVGNTYDLADAVNQSHESTAKPVSNQSLAVDESLPLMPLLEKTDEPMHVIETESIDAEMRTGAEGMRSLSHIVLPRIEKRASFTESVHDISEIEISKDSVLSLNLECLFETDQPCTATKNVDIDVLRVVDTGDSSGSARIDVEMEQAPAALDYGSDKTDFEQSVTETVRYAESPSGKEASDPSSEVYAKELPFDEKKQAGGNDCLKPDFDKSEPVHGNGADIDGPQDDNSDERPTQSPGRIGAVHPESVAIETRDMADASSDIIHHEVNSDYGSPRYRKRDEIVMSPSGRVRVTMIERALHDDDSDDEDDDDVVRSEGDSVLTPQSHPCECLINVARQFEENVSADFAKNSQCALARHHLCIPTLDQNEEKVPRVSVTSNVFPTTVLLEESRPSLTESTDLRKSSLRRALSCPNFIAHTEADTSIDSFLTIPHESNFSARRITSPLSASDNGFTARSRRQLIHASSVLDPCQSASPFRETMDDMMKNFSPNRSIEMARRERLVAQENRDFLHNYLYCSKPSGQPVKENTDPVMCGDHCDFMSGVLDTYRSIVPMRSSSGKDMLSLNAGVDETYPPARTETWFDVASEHFDGALERVMGSAHAQSRRWNSMFQAPSLKSKKENRLPKASRKSTDVGILLVKQSKDSQDGEVSEQQFEFMYGMKREEFVQLPVTERSRLHDKAHENLARRWTMTRPTFQGTTGPSGPPPSPATSTSTRNLSSSGLPKMDRLI